MSSEDALAALKNKLAGLESENSARMALLDKRRAEAAAESKEKLEKQGKIQGEVFVRLQERNRRAKAAGGWATESTVGDKTEDETQFGFEEDEEENERRAGYRPADEHPLPAAYRAPTPPPPPPPVQPPPAAPEPGRHRRSAARSDDDDFANTDWLAT